jgi:CPA2 family monovalent cation:H+ antiporter-2
VQRLRDERIDAVYGDANHIDTLQAAGVAHANALILTASGLKNAGEVIRLARGLNPHIRILVRSAYLRERPPLHEAGADEVFAGEGEVALAMTEYVLKQMGAVPEQIDRERERVRAELFGADPVSDVAPVSNAPTIYDMQGPPKEGDESSK